MIKKATKAVIYARCSTDESKQDVEVQLKELRRYCEAYGWSYDEVSEYGSGFKKNCQPALDQVLEKIRLKHYDKLICFSMDRFSRQSPGKINALLDRIVDNYGCRFLALQQSIDSDNELTWCCIKPLFTYFANKFSKDLGEKIRKGIERKRERGIYKGGRPKKNGRIDIQEVKRIHLETNSLRKTAQAYNESRYKDNRISYQYVRRVLVGNI